MDMDNNQKSKPATNVQKVQGLFAAASLVEIEAVIDESKLDVPVFFDFKATDFSPQSLLLHEACGRSTVSPSFKSHISALSSSSGSNIFGKSFYVHFFR